VNLGLPFQRFVYFLSVVLVRIAAVCFFASLFFGPFLLTLGVWVVGGFGA